MSSTSSSCLLDEEDGDGSNYVAITEIDAAYKDAQCTHFATCGIFPDKATCLSAELNLSSFGIDEGLAGGIYNGHIIYNGSQVKACMDAIAARSCDKTDRTYRAIPTECRNFFRGTLMANESCFVNEECISQRCSSGGSSTTCSQGACIGDIAPTVAPAEIGADCTSGFGCVTGAYCDTSTDTCTALKAAATTCTLDQECAYGLACIGNTGTRVCGTLPAIGQACNTNGICRDVGAWCDFNANACKQVGLMGTMCTSDTECSQYFPCTLATNTSTCTRGPALGQSCSGGSACFDAGTFCDFNTVTCVALKGIGQPCNNSSECDSDFCDFNASTPTCTAPMSCF